MAVNHKLFLRGIDGAKLFLKYLNSDFDHKQIKKLEKSAKIVKVNLSVTYGDSPLKSTYQYSDNYNQKQMIIKLLLVNG